ncbi:hypothetical protein CYMTET_50041 [Cymbomonas tetramitiformis]|uniref:AB hydrolase-1 domain-containing protein n=1 Tax=Cymbomonas tetramitiformis TaxID=36881 RepID=A0AAE0BQW9_9CHLO|nr:hypothetical protein CYMTET_50041 [Cymbomonas tetramitiformis]
MRTCVLISVPSGFSTSFGPPRRVDLRRGCCARRPSCSTKRTQAGNLVSVARLPAPLRGPCGYKGTARVLRLAALRGSSSSAHFDEGANAASAPDTQSPSSPIWFTRRHWASTAPGILSRALTELFTRSIHYFALAYCVWFFATGQWQATQSAQASPASLFFYCLSETCFRVVEKLRHWYLVQRSKSLPHAAPDERTSEDKLALVETVLRGLEAALPPGAGSAERATEICGWFVAGELHTTSLHPDWAEIGQDDLQDWVAWAFWNLRQEDVPADDLSLLQAIAELFENWVNFGVIQKPPITAKPSLHKPIAGEPSHADTSARNTVGPDHTGAEDAPSDGMKEEKEFRVEEEGYVRLDAADVPCGQSQVLAPFPPLLKGRSPKGIRVTPLRLTLDPIQYEPRPLLSYIVTHFVCHCVVTHSMMRARGFRRQYSSEAKLGCWWLTPPAPSNGAADVTGAGARPPILFIHGLGVGILPYIRQLDALLTAEPGRSVFILDLPNISLYTAPDASMPSPFEVAEGIVKMLGCHGVHEGVHVMGHSYGTAVAAWLVKWAPPRWVAACTLLDPICFLLYNHSVAFNFVYRRPTTPLDCFLNYFVAKELNLAYVLHRHFFWQRNLLTLEQLGEIPTSVVLSEMDRIVPTAAVRRYLAGASKYVLVQELEGNSHAEFVIRPSSWQVVIAAFRDAEAHYHRSIMR